MPVFLAISLLSDTHELHRELDRLPGGDILIHAGDFSLFSKSWTAIEDFAAWFAEQPYRHKILTLGNHEFGFEADLGKRSLFERQGITILVNEPVEIEGLKVWGSPVTPLYGGAFGVSSPVDRQRHWATIPGDTDVLITHGPPFGIFDTALGNKEHQGDPELLAAVRRVRPLLHVFGHVHGGLWQSRTGRDHLHQCGAAWSRRRLRVRPGSPTASPTCLSRRRWRCIKLIRR